MLYKWCLVERAVETKATFPTWYMSEQDALAWAEKFGCTIRKIPGSGVPSGRRRSVTGARSQASG